MPSLLQTVNRLIHRESSWGAVDPENVYFYYMQIVSQARNPVFYERLGVPDTIEGRFDCISLHMALMLMSLKKRGGAAQSFSQDLFDLFFADVDRNLREIGVGDLSVGRQVKKLASNFYGVLQAYEEGMNAPKLLPQALERNLFNAKTPDPLTYAILESYMRDSLKKLDTIDLDETPAQIEWPAVR